MKNEEKAEYERKMNVMHNTSRFKLIFQNITQIFSIHFLSVNSHNKRRKKEKTNHLLCKKFQSKNMRRTTNVFVCCLDIFVRELYLITITGSK